MPAVMVRRVPVLEIRPLDAAARATSCGADRFDIVICVSGHAVRLRCDRSMRSGATPGRLTWIAVGAATARALAERGIDGCDRRPNRRRVYWRFAPLSRVVGQRVLICAGRDGRPLLAEELAQRGAIRHVLALYEREAVPANAWRRFGDAAIGAVIVSSADGARAFAPRGARSAATTASPSSRRRRALRRN